MKIDHVVLWVEDPKQALAFYTDLLGLPAVRAQEYQDGTVPFPSVRINEATIIDLMARRNAPKVAEFTGGGGASGGTPINHLCLSMNAAEYDAISSRLAAQGITLTSGGDHAFGAQGGAVRSTYLCDPDGNVIEMRYYDEGQDSSL